MKKPFKPSITPYKVFQNLSKTVLKVFQITRWKGFGRVLEGFWKDLTEIKNTLNTFSLKGRYYLLLYKSKGQSLEVDHEK